MCFVSPASSILDCSGSNTVDIRYFQQKLPNTGRTITPATWGTRCCHHDCRPSVYERRMYVLHQSKLVRSPITSLNQASAHAIPGKPFCVIISIPKSFYMLWTPVLIFHTILLALYSYQGFKVFGRVPWRHAGLLDLIYRDSLLNFLAYVF